ncbi:ABC transporter ATP-binding protein [Deinococcus metallilatus]|uniref:ABC transporter ATP-binding protein n=1 Tax=Deinococcus metallilatus TaxID=1211322 RepID=A0AAJ5F3N6_9DEIO|nr:ABC transporter ATP-binding protein [Deinococcus metallilatus]MBB5296278.1 osmoprotectant transport system ATP-binding protein [Deinococcus metallilatus]QBY10036.1 ABC transporter ATP-binding protein [Deinococcus metallilatus]RXJ08761.1 ABC transporter ATP-binding protein [Deinococcus metallilatus]TLK25235.1 ABC transporter ATP-binding protein [Deinococcus metallilatus]GMA14810.1 ABC transporter ATP-binding protein [Deinococcus metallilatus]
MIELQHLEKRYGDTWAVRDLSLVFPEGELTALLGPSGCGKTTTLRMINRLTEPSGGRVLLGGRDTRDFRPEDLRRGIGYVIQQIGLFPHLTVAQNVATVPDLLGWDRRRTARRVDELLALVGLDPPVYRAKRPGELSGGQAQRVGVARALAADPPVLLMDEPFGALDPLARDRLQEAFRGIQQRLRKTVVLVTHDIDEALRLGDRVALMRGGTLAQFGTPDDLIHRPASLFVRQFLGEDAALRQLAGRAAAEFVRPGDGAGLPTVEGTLDARSALGVMLREGSDALAVTQDGVPLGVLRWEALQTQEAQV